VSVLFGPGKTNFVEKTIQQLKRGEKYVVAADQMGSATYTLDAAEKILEVVESAPSGIYHLCNQGACSRYELAVETARLAGLDASKIIGKPMDEMKRPGPRLKYSVMEMGALAKVGITPPRSWQEALAEYVNSYLLR
jgi:dTDP-4-dehydrorhamnose reductase